MNKLLPLFCYSVINQNKTRKKVSLLIIYIETNFLEIYVKYIVEKYQYSYSSYCSAQLFFPKLY